MAERKNGFVSNEGRKALPLAPSQDDEKWSMHTTIIATLPFA
jgi:hypothetical protein